MSISEGIVIPIKFEADTSSADAAASGTQANFDKMGLGMASAARSAVNGIQGLLSAEQGIYQAQQRVNIANLSYIETVRQYGAGSIQATKSLEELRNAQESVAVAQQQLTLRFVQFAVTTGPQIYTALSRVAAASMGVTLANYQETASWYAKAAAIALTVGILTAGLAVFAGIMASASTTAAANQASTQSIQMTQTNNFAGGSGGVNLGLANAQLVGGMKSAVRP